jgi:uncharacterized membrane protein YfcA
MTLPQVLLLFLSAVLGGTLNAVAGGASIFTFLALCSTGVLPVQANATSTVALWPGVIASTSTYRRELALQRRGLLFLLIGTSLIGGMLGALLLLKTQPSTFVHLIPYLLLMSTLLFTFSGPITAWLRMRNSEKTHTSRTRLFGTSLAQFVIATYGGYFGGGMSILVLATLAMMGMKNIHKMNAVKTLLNACVNAVAIIAFIAAGVIAWQEATLMVVGSVIGGFGGAHYARRIDQKWVRFFVIIVGFGLTMYFFRTQL